MKPSEHINLVAIFHIAWSALLLIATSLVVVLLGAGGLFAESEESAYIALIVGAFASTFMVATSVAGFVGAWGLFKRRGWGRLTIMVLSAVWLIKIPVGTALGVYSFYALTREQVVDLFDAPEQPVS